MKNFFFSLTALSILSGSSFADVIITNDGARLIGDVTLIDKGVVHFATAYAGTLKIQQDQITSIETDAPMTVRTDAGSVASGKVQSSGGNQLTVQSSDGSLNTTPTTISAAWAIDEIDPEILRNQRKWTYEIGFDFFGKDGNTDEASIGASADATLKGPNDVLNFYAFYSNREQNEETTDDELVGGASYENYFSDIVGWYVRTELERDDIEGIDFRSTSGAGLSYRLIDKDVQSLVFRTGFGYRFTAYETDIDDESTATLDFGIKHRYDFAPWLQMKNEFVYVPSIDDIGEYTAVHDSSISMPLAGSKSWTLRAGIKNDYESQPVTEEKLDTTYYSKIVYSWK